MPEDVRNAIEKAAFSNGRTVTAEINLRLRASLTSEGHPVVYTSLNSPDVYGGKHAVREAENGLSLSATDHAMLAVFHKMPVEKQLALLSLFK